MLRSTIWLTTCAVLTMASPASALFAPVVDGRAIHAEFFDPYFFQVLDEAPPTAFAAWQDQVYAGGAYFASQDSEAITATRMAASGLADGFSEIGNAISTFAITFDVNVPTEYVLSGSLSENSVAFNEAQLVLRQGASVIFSAAANADTISFLDSGVLAPGQYELFAQARWDDNIEFAPAGSAEYDFVFEVVPEPRTGLLFAFAGLTLVASARDRVTRRRSFSPAAAARAGRPAS